VGSPQRAKDFGSRGKKVMLLPWLCLWLQMTLEMSGNSSDIIPDPLCWYCVPLGVVVFPLFRHREWASFSFEHK